jgi:hypothetical protein
MALVKQTDSYCINGYLEDAVVSNCGAVMFLLKLTVNYLILNEHEVTVPSDMTLGQVTLTSVS